MTNLLAPDALLPQRISVKLFAASADSTKHDSVDHWVRLFHRFIQDSLIPNTLLIDVHDYRHLHHGPGVMLVAHEAHYRMEHDGLVVARKRGLQGDWDDRVVEVFRSSLVAARAIEDGTPGFQFVADRFEFCIDDRLVAPPSDETVSSFCEVLRLCFERRFGSQTTIHSQERPRGPVGATVLTSTTMSSSLLSTFAAYSSGLPPMENSMRSGYAARRSSAAGSHARFRTSVSDSSLSVSITYGPDGAMKLGRSFS